MRRLKPFEVTPEMLEAQQAASRDRTVDGMRAYDGAVAALDAWGRKWREIVRDAIAAGLSAEEFALLTDSDLADVLTALGSDDEEATDE